MLAPPRTFAPRLSIGTRYAPCEADWSALVPRSKCGAAPSLDGRRLGQLRELWRRMSAELRVEDSIGGMRRLSRTSGEGRTEAGNADADALHASALLDLIWSGDQPRALERSIAYLRSAAELSDSTADVLADLSAAELLRAEQRQDPISIFAALEAADAASERTGAAASPDARRAAAFNSALALDRARLAHQAARAWISYAAINPASPWGASYVARARRAQDSTAEPPPVPDSPAPALRSFARGNPQGARVLGMDHWLGEWGSAVLAGDSARATVMLAAVSALAEGAQLAGAGVDRTLADAVAAIDVVTRLAAADRIRTVARVHRLYAAAQASYAATDYSGAERLFARLLRNRRDLPEPLRLWTVFGRGAALVYGGDPATRDRLLREASRADSVRYPALVSRARWALGTVSLRTGGFERAVEYYALARRGFERAGEKENAGATSYLQADALASLGDRAAAYEELLRALDGLHPPSVWRHNALFVLARTLESDGLRRAALHAVNEDVETASRLEPRIYLAEALVTRARLLTAEQRAAAETDLDSAQAVLERLPDGLPRRWVAEQLRAVRAAALASTRPAAAIVALDSVIDFFAGRNAVRYVAAIVARAQARMATGDATGASSDLDAAIAHMDRERRAFAREGNRQALLDAMRSVVDRLIVLRLSRGRAAAALAASEKGRSVLSPYALPESGPAIPALPAGERAVVYRLVGDSLVTWTLSSPSAHVGSPAGAGAGHDSGSAGDMAGSAGIRVRVTNVDSRALRAGIARLRRQLELSAPAGSTRQPLSELYDLLVRPVGNELGLSPAAVTADDGRRPGGGGARGSTLTIVPDGVLAAIPFAALFDTVTGRYLVEDRALRVESSVRDAAIPPRPQGRRALTSPTRRIPDALLVSNPAFRARDYPSLTPLAGADREVSELARLYPRARVLRGRAAVRDSVVTALLRMERTAAGANVFHFAGHAVADGQRPERSFLLLAGEDGGARSERLTADDIRALPLGRVRLVVLAACETLGAGGGLSAGASIGASGEAAGGGFRGLAAALRAAGVGGVVGTLWRIDDLASVELMVGLHRAFLREGEGALALRAAQRRLIRLGRPPSEWAGFQYSGR